MFWTVNRIEDMTKTSISWVSYQNEDRVDVNLMKLKDEIIPVFVLFVSSYRIQVSTRSIVWSNTSRSVMKIGYYDSKDQEDCIIFDKKDYRDVGIDCS